MTPQQIERLKAEHKEVIKSGDKQRIRYFRIGAYTVYNNICFSKDGTKIYFDGKLISEVAK